MTVSSVSKISELHRDLQGLLLGSQTLDRFLKSIPRLAGDSHLLVLDLPFDLEFEFFEFVNDLFALFFGNPCLNHDHLTHALTKGRFDGLILKREKGDASFHTFVLKNVVE